MTITGTEAYEAIRTHHRMLSEQLTSRAAAVAGAVAAGRPHQAAVASLLNYLTGEVLPHAAAEEETIYPAAALHSGLIGTVNEMLAEHRTLSSAGRGAHRPGRRRRGRRAGNTDRGAIHRARGQGE